MTGEIDKLERLLSRVIEEGNRGFSVMTEVYHWSIPMKLKEEIEDELIGISGGDSETPENI